MQISRYAADHGVAFPDLFFNTQADEGQLQHTKLCLLSPKTLQCMVLKWVEAHVQRYSS